MSQPTLHLSGLSRDDEAAFRVLLDQAQPQLRPHWTLTDEAQAAVLLVDIDSMYGQMAWMRALGSGKPLIALTEGARADTPHLLRRPVAAEVLADLLNAIAAETLLPAASTASAASAAPLAAVDPAPIPVPEPAAETAAAAPPAVTTAPEPEPEPEPEVLTLGSAFTSPAAAEPAPSAALPAGLDASARYKLERWPQIDRSYPKHFRIATLMLKGPTTLDEVAAATGASVEEVAEFVAARLLSGHAVQV
ncbi:MAG TPA: hypothetical protein VFY12_10315 [Arenimonas sp.]|nr:hypothetical protein [Arenimonas sp.]